MIEKTYSKYQKKITPYLDGSLTPEDRTEFEAFAQTHPGFDTLISSKREEIQLIKGLIPQIQLSERAAETLETEMKQSVFNLLKREPKNFWERMKDSYEEWSSR